MHTREGGLKRGLSSWSGVFVSFLVFLSGHFDCMSDSVLRLSGQLLHVYAGVNLCHDGS